MRWRTWLLGFVLAALAPIAHLSIQEAASNVARLPSSGPYELAARTAAGDTRVQNMDYVQSILRGAIWFDDTTLMALSGLAVGILAVFFNRQARVVGLVGGIALLAAIGEARPSVLLGVVLYAATFVAPTCAVRHRMN